MSFWDKMRAAILRGAERSDKVISTIEPYSSGLGVGLSRAFIAIIRKYPIMGFLGWLVLTVAMISILAVPIARSLGKGTSSPPEITYEKQLSQLGQTESSLNDLLTFVVAERQRIKEKEELIESLKSQHNKLKPLVEADVKAVQALFDEQARLAAKNAAGQWWVGLMQGVLGSLVASLIFAFGTAYYMRRKTGKLLVLPNEDQ